LERIENAAAGSRRDRRRSPVCVAGVVPRIELGWRLYPADQAKNRLVTKKPAARIAVVPSTDWRCRARHEAGATAHAEAAAFGLLSSTSRSHGNDHEVNDDNDGLHF